MTAYDKEATEFNNAVTVLDWNDVAGLDDIDGNAQMWIIDPPYAYLEYESVVPDNIYGAYDAHACFNKVIALYNES